MAPMMSSRSPPQVARKIHAFSLESNKGSEVVLPNDNNGREKLKRHREEIAGRVVIPEEWGQEEMLKDWIDSSTAFEALIAPNKISSARKALAADGLRRSGLTTSTSQRIESRC